MLSYKGHHPSAKHYRKESKPFDSLGRTIAKSKRLWCLLKAMRFEDALFKRSMDRSSVYN